jgi:hypothetical protein
LAGLADPPEYTAPRMSAVMLNAVAYS